MLFHSAFYKFVELADPVAIAGALRDENAASQPARNVPQRFRNRIGVSEFDKFVKRGVKLHRGVRLETAVIISIRGLSLLVCVGLRRFS